MSDNRKIVRAALEQLGAAPEKSFVQPPADAATVALVSRTLVKAGYAALPEDFTMFLTMACGVQGPYCTLLSPGGMEMAGGGVQPGIQQASEAFSTGTAAEDKLLVLGRASGDVLLVFASGRYRLLDAQSHDVLRTYDSVAAFITDMIALRSGG